MIPRAFLRALGQIGDARFRGVLIRALLLTIATLAALVWAVSWLLAALLPDHFSLPLLGEFALPGGLGSGLGVGLGLVLSVVLMVPVAGGFVGLFLEEIAAAVEARHYPGLPPVRRQPIAEQALESLRFLAVFLGVNAVAAIAYLLFAPVALVLFWLVNGWLLGREYYQLVAQRRLGLKAADAARRRSFFTIWLAGTLMAIPLTVPVASLVVPILGVATFTHLFHALENGARGGDQS